MDPPRPRPHDEHVTREEFEAFKREVRESIGSLHELNGKMMRVVNQTYERLLDVQGTTDRLDRWLAQPGSVQEIARRTAREAAEEITERRQLRMPSDPIKKAIEGERNAMIARGVTKVVGALGIGLSLLVAGMLIRDCQHGAVPTEIPH